METQPFLNTADWERRLGGEVREVRMRIAMTQAELAEAANVSLSSVKSLEAGRGSTLSTMVRVTRALGRTDWLDTFAPPTAPVSPMELLRNKQQAARRTPVRVRHRKTR
jgi:transcriptional regulator with XRE-family HTH domain